MKQRVHAATASILIAAVSAAAMPASAEVAHPIMIVNRSATPEDKLARSTQACVELAVAGRFEEAMPLCNLAIRYSEALATAEHAPSIDPAAVRSNRAVVSWLLGRDQRAAADMAVAVAQAPEASFVRKNLVAMGMESPATTLLGVQATDVQPSRPRRVRSRSPRSTDPFRRLLLLKQRRAASAGRCGATVPAVLDGSRG